MGRKKPEFKQIRKLKAEYRKNPESKLFFPLARLYEKVEELDTAKKILEDGLKKYPHYYGAKAFLGEILYKNNEFEEAQSHLEAVIKKVPENLLAHRILAKIYTQQGRKDLADEQLRVATLITPDHPETPSIDYLVERFTPLTKEEAEEKELTQKKERKKKNKKKYIEKKEKESKEEETKADSGTDEILTTTLAELYYSQGLIDKAIDIYTKLSEKAPQDKALNRRLNELKHEAGTETPQSPSGEEEGVTETYAELYYSQGLIDKAIDVYTKLLKKEPDNETWHTRLTELKQVLEQESSLEITESSYMETEGSPNAHADNQKESESSLVDGEIPIEQEEFSLGIPHCEIPPDEDVKNTMSDEKKLIVLQFWIDTIRRLRERRSERG
ncbi:MAG: tetratricopeptide repeat protein [bacterium]